jgi:SAM-dependent methyltransferase/diadenosine tetraphosphate (Ap4A) HIT family hydrolase
LAAEPFYAAYKRRVRELLEAGPGGRFLDVGAGAGDGALALTAESGAQAVGSDTSLVMAGTMREGGLAQAIVADGHRLPFRDSCFDGAWADRVLQHVEDPEQVVDEMTRVVRPGGRIVLADPDYATQVLDIEDQDLAARVLRFRAEAALRNGTLAHRHPGTLAARGLEDVAVEARTLVVRDPTAVDNVMGLRTWAHTAAARGHLDPAEADRFVVQFDRAVRTERFTYSVTFFLTSGTLPGPGAAPSARAMTGDWRKDRIGAALRGENPTVLRRLEAGFAVIGDVQFLPGYSVLLTDEPGVQRLSDLPRAKRLLFLSDMERLGEAVERACRRLDPDFRRVNLEILGNTDPFLHAHVWPRYEWEPAELVGRPVWRYPHDRWSDERFGLGPRHAVLREAIGSELDRLRSTA